MTDSSTKARSIENYDFQFSKSEIRPRFMYFFRVSFLTSLDIYNAYFKSHYTRIQRPRDLFSLWELLCLYAIGFCNQVLLHLHSWWSEELCSHQHLFKLLELVFYWDPCKALVTNYVRTYVIHLLGHMWFTC